MYISVSFVCYLLLLFVNSSFSNFLTTTQQNQFLSSVNSVRSTVRPAGNLPSLTTDSKLASYAANWTDSCYAAPHRKYKILYGFAYLKISTQQSPQQVVDIWQSESSAIKFFEPYEFDDAPNYANLVGQRTTKMGCAATKCGDSYLYACLFTRRSVWPGILPYNTTCVPQTIDCDAKGNCGTYENGCYLTRCGPDCSDETPEPEPTQESLSFMNQRADTVNLDYRTKGYVTPIKNQASCGSCAAHTAVEVVESAWAMKYKKLYRLSAQQAMDCVGAVSVCSRGMWYDTVFQWSKNQKNSFVNETVLPYTAANKACPTLKAGQVFGNPTQPSIYVGKTEAAIISALTTRGPLAVAMFVESGFQSYRSGVYSKACTDAGSKNGGINHAVTIIGYGSTSTGQKYWIGRNHWATYWGESGYFRFARGVNLCNIETNAIAWVPK